MILGAIRAVATAGEPGEILFFFCPVSNARLRRFPAGQISRHLNTTCRSMSRWTFSEHNFENFPVRGRFSKKNVKNLKFFSTPSILGCHNSAIYIYIYIDRRKFVAKWFLYEMSSFHFYRWNQFKVIPVACTVRSINYPQNFRRRRTKYASSQFHDLETSRVHGCLQVRISAFVIHFSSYFRFPR